MNAMRWATISAILLSLATPAASDSKLIKADEFSAALLRPGMTCELVEDANRIIYLLGKYDEGRFGADRILKQIILYGCDEFLPGLQEERLISEATLLLGQTPQGPFSTDYPAPSYMQADVCDPVTLNTPDGLGMLLHAIIVFPGGEPTPLYQKVREKIHNCRFQDVWQPSLTELKKRFHY